MMDPNVTEPCQQPEDERSSEELYRSLVEHALQGWVVIQEGRVRFANPAIVELSGYAAEELLNFSPEQVRAVVHPEDRARIWETMTKRLAGEPVPARQEFRFLRKDGQVRWVETMARVMDYRGKPAVQVSYLDITDRKQAEEALHRREAILSAVARAVQEIATAPHLDRGVAPALRWLGEAAGVSRVYLFENELDERGVLRTSQRAEWVAPGITPQIDNPELQHFPYEEAGFRRWVEVLSQGQALYGQVRDFPATERPVLEAQDILSILIAPIMVAGRWWGFIGFDDCRREREWSPSEIDALKIAAGVLGSAIQLRQMEEAWRAERDRAQRYLDLAGILFVALNDRGEVTLINRTGSELLGYAPEEIVGQNWFNRFLPAREREPVRRVFERLMAGELEPVEYAENSVLTSDGSERTIAWRNTLLTDEDGRPIGTLSAGMDITDRKRSELERQVMLEIMQGVALTPNLQALFPLIHHWIGQVIDARNFYVVLYDPQRGQFQEVYTVDERDQPAPPSELAKGLTGYVYRTGQPFVLDLRRFMELVARGEVELVGSPSASWMGVPLKTPNGVIGVMVVQNYTEPDRYSERDREFLASVAAQVALAIERRRAEEEHARLQEQFYQAQKMEAVGRLAGGVAHDFNNLLTIIQLSARLMGKQLHAEDPLQVQLERIQEACQRATELTKQLLTFSRQTPLERRRVDLNDSIREMSRMLPRLLGEDIELVLALSEDLWPVVGDANQLDQVLLNLAVNARDAMPQGGRLRIETANVVLDRAYTEHHFGVEPGEYVMLAVSDTGVGMSEEVKAHIFEPFFTTKGSGQGTGLGLSTVYGIVKRHGGHIGVYSEPGQGTTFTVYLPRAAERRAVERPPSARDETGAPSVGGTETVLVVDDDAQIREMIRDVLTAHGYRVLTAPDGVEALQVAAQYEGTIHLLLTDVIMPRLNGPALAEQLRPSRPEMQVLYMSGYTDDIVAHRGVLEGADFLAKPLQLETLLRKVREVLDSTDAGRAHS